MHKIFLVNMPFAALNTPSLPLTQLNSILDDQFEGRAFVQTLYLNLDFAHYVGVALYQHIALAVESLGSGIGEWFFRQAAFPDLPDNAQEYFSRYYPQPVKRVQVLKYAIQKKRQGLDDYLDELIIQYALDQAEIVGFTSMFSQNLACFAMARKLKERNPDIIIVMGGANCESPMGQEIVRRIPQFDYVFSGPALKSFPEFVGHYLDQNRQACERINGVFSKTNVVSFSNRETADGSTESSAFGQELDIDANVKLDYEPFLTAFERHFPGGKVKPVLLFETSRGCWWGERVQCAFCGLNSTRIHHRSMSPEKAIAHFKSLFKYAPHFAYLGCADNVMPKDYIAQVLPYLDTPPDVTILYELKVPVSEQDVQILSETGAKVVQPGIEALTTPALKLMRKGATAFQNLLCLKNCLIYGVYPVWNLLIGLPGEKEEIYTKYLHDIPLFVHLPPPTGVQTLRFDRYSPYFVNAQQYGLDLQPSDFYKLIYPFDQEVLKNVAYHFANQNFDAPYLATMCKWIDKLGKLCSQWWTRWHDQGSALPPKLFFKPNGDHAVVYDSRSEQVVEHQLDPTTIEVLKYLHQPRKLADLAKALGHIQDFDPVQEIELLRSRGLIFEEDERFLSLVLPQEPPLLGDRVSEYLSSFADFLANFSSVTS